MTIAPPPRRLGRGLIAVAVDQMSSLGLRPGDVVSVRGTRLTHARVMPAPRGTIITANEEVLRNAGAPPKEKLTVESLEKTVLPRLHSVILRAKGTQAPDVERVAETLHDQVLTVGDHLAIHAEGTDSPGFEVMSLEPGPAGLFCDSTLVSVQDDPHHPGGYDRIGGLSDQIARVHEMVATPLLRPDLFHRLGISAPRGVLFYGPPGSGKTLLARAIAERTSSAFFVINGPEIVSKHYGESESALRSIFSAAEKAAPAIIFIDEIDAIAPRREALSGEKQVERRVVAQLLTLMDGLSQRGQIVVMAATNLPDSLDPALRRPGRFDREIAFVPPNVSQRREILGVHLRDAPLAQDVDLDRIARDSHGYVGADLAALSREAALAALDRSVKAAGGEANVKTDTLFITQTDLVHGLQVTSPSALRDLQIETPVVSFADVGGMDAAKQALTEAVIWPHRHRDLYAALNLRPCSGVLLSGPPGSGKTLLARALAHESGMNFIPVRPSKIISHFLGDAERALSEVFSRARHSAPAIIFLDELDSLAPRRNGKDAALDRIVAQLLTDMDGLHSNAGVVVLGATNRASAIDPALTRPGRFDRVISIGLPDAAARRAILQVHAHLPAWDDPALIEALIARTDGKSGADLAVLANAAVRSALRRSIQEGLPSAMVTQQDIDVALAQLQASEIARAEDFILPAGGIDAPT